MRGRQHDDTVWNDNAYLNNKTCLKKKKNEFFFCPNLVHIRITVYVWDSKENKITLSNEISRTGGFQINEDTYKGFFGEIQGNENCFE